MSYFHQLVADMLAAQGVPEEEAQKLSEGLLRGLLACQALPQANVDAWNLDARIYELRGKRLTAALIAERVGVTERLVFKAVRRHGQRRRAALRSSA